MFSALLYFDHNATHPLSPAARAAWLDAVDRFPGNPSSPHRLGQRAEKALEDARATLGQHLGCAPENIVFTSGATESANMVLAAFPSVAVSALEHPCVLESPARSALIPSKADGQVDLAALTDIVTQGKPHLVALMAANNETGVLQPWQDALAICRAAGVPLMCDAAQWIGKLPSHELGAADFVIGCAHKFGGPTGVGFLACRRPIPALLRGGPQENQRRPGTENLAGILSMTAAFADCAASFGSIAEREQWRDEFERNFVAAVPEMKVLGHGAPRLWNTSAVLMPELNDCRRRWVVLLDKLGFAVSTGSACSSGKEKPSHVLTAMGIPSTDAGRALRFSSGWTSTRESWMQLLTGILEAVTKARDIR